MKYLLTLFLRLSTSVLAELKIDHAWVKKAPPVVPMRVAYFTFINTSSTPITITKITSPQFSAIEAHETVYQNNMYSMKALDTLTIAPHETLNFKPKGKHLMLMLPTQDISSLTAIQLNFHYAPNKTLSINAPIKELL